MDLHLDMHGTFKPRSLPRRIVDAFRAALRPDIYGLKWGNPDTDEPLRFIRDQYLLPYVGPDVTALEIGPGGGRWTRYLLPCRKVYVVDPYEELLHELTRSVRSPNLHTIRNAGSDLPLPEPVDFEFSFGVFVHLPPETIDAYLGEMKTVLRSGGNAVIQYADKNKIIAQRYDSFTDMTPEKMRKMLTRHGWRIHEEDTTTLWHSSVVRFG